MSRRLSDQERIWRAIPEKDLLQTIRDTARALGWLAYHTLRSKGSEPGFPDLVLVKGATLLFVEVKTERGIVTAAQQNWFHGINRALPRGAWVVRPSNRDGFLAMLKGE